MHILRGVEISRCATPRTATLGATGDGRSRLRQSVVAQRYLIFDFDSKPGKRERAQSDPVSKGSSDPFSDEGMRAFFVAQGLEKRTSHIRFDFGRTGTRLNRGEKAPEPRRSPIRGKN